METLNSELFKIEYPNRAIVRDKSFANDAGYRIDEKTDDYWMNNVIGDAGRSTSWIVYLRFENNVTFEDHDLVDLLVDDLLITGKTITFFENWYHVTFDPTDDPENEGELLSAFRFIKAIRDAVHPISVEKAGEVQKKHIRLKGNAKLKNDDIEGLTEKLSIIEAKADSPVSSSLGSIKPSDAAPTPARNGNYTFSIGGNKPEWLTAEAGVTTVKAGDGVAVVYTAPSSYSYTHVDVSSDFVKKETGKGLISTTKEGNIPANTNDEILDINKSINGFERYLIDGTYWGIQPGFTTVESYTSERLSSLVVKCKNGDQFYIKTQGRNVGHPYYVVSQLGGVAPIVDSGLNNTAAIYEITISDINAKYLIVNTDIAYKSNVIIRKNKDIQIANNTTAIANNTTAIANNTTAIANNTTEINGTNEPTYNTLNINDGSVISVITSFAMISGKTYRLRITGVVSGTTFSYTSIRPAIDANNYDANVLIRVINYADYANGTIEFTFTPSQNYLGLRFYTNGYTTAYSLSVQLKNTTDFNNGLKNRVILLENKISTLETKVAILENDVQEKTIICCWGSSSVEGYLGDKDKFVSNASGTLDISNASGIKMSFPRMLASLVNADKYEVWNCGIGGEGVPTVLSRMGAIPMCNDTDFVLPADGSWVDCARYDNNTFLKSLYDDSIVVPNEVYVGAYSSDAQSVLNPVIINGIECTLDLYSPNGQNITNNSGSNVFQNGAFRIKRNIAGISNLTIKSGTLITPYSAKLFKNRKVIHIYLIGANGGWYNWPDWLEKTKRVIDWFGHKYLICGYHTPAIFSNANYSSAQISQFSINVPSATDFRTLQKKEYGLKFLDLRNKVSKWWFIDFATELGLKIHYVSNAGAGTFNGNTYVADDISVIPTEYRTLLEEMPTEWKNYNLPSDIQCYNLEMPPTTLMADGVSQVHSGQHCNHDGYKVLGMYVYRKLVETGMITI